jgi:mannose/fructose/N-acetylgalactosamine-specific phosphotransferase system component IID
MLRDKSKTQLVNQERNTQNAIALLNYLKRIAPQQLMLIMQVFMYKLFKHKKRNSKFINKIL